MPGLIEEYNYDIFISYRQNDNKYDGWVSEFVSNLRKELEATIKEKLTVYFDENPVDGILEIHSVDQSLTAKLKCLIFIPVISQTYSDKKSYAWQYEFCVFNRLAQQDRLGRNIILPNGNVTSRILAVKIHDIDPEDIMIIENETGEKLRSIDFIYRSAGVNRPLRAREDHPGSNLNKTYYRDQINKVANTVRDIIIAVKKKTGNNSDEISPVTSKRKILQNSFIHRLKRLAATFLVLVFIMFLFLFYSTSVKKQSAIEKSIAVLPFRNDSPNDSNTYFINGIMEEILNNLQKIKDVRIISRTSVEQYRNTSKPIPQIARELGVNYIVEGSGQRHGNSFRINVQLIRARKENYLWGKLYDQKISNPGDIINVQSSVAQSIVSELKGTITPQEKQIIEKIPTTNLTAYDYYQKGKEELSSFWIDITNTSALIQAEKLFKKALQSDPAFSRALSGQAEVMWNKHYYMQKENMVDSVFLLTDIALKYDNKNADAYVIKGWCYDDAGHSDRARESYMRAIELNPNDWKAYFGLAELYDFEDPVRSLQNLQRAVSLTHGANEMPTLLRHIGGQLLVTGFIEKAGVYFARAFELDGDSAIYLSCLGGIEQNQGNYDKALDIYARAIKIKGNYNEVIHNLAIYSQLSRKNSESLKYYRELESRNAINFNMHRMGYSLMKNGYQEEGKKYLEKHIDYCNDILRNGRRSDLIAYTYYDLAGIYALLGDEKRTYQNLDLFSRSKNCYLYMVTLIKNDPFFDNIKDEPGFRKVITDMESKYGRVHEEVARWLADQENF